MEPVAAGPGSAHERRVPDGARLLTASRRRTALTSRRGVNPDDIRDLFEGKPCFSGWRARTGMACPSFLVREIPPRNPADVSRPRFAPARDQLAGDHSADASRPRPERNAVDTKRPAIPGWQSFNSAPRPTPRSRPGRAVPRRRYRARVRPRPHGAHRPRLAGSQTAAATWTSPSASRPDPADQNRRAGEAARALSPRRRPARCGPGIRPRPEDRIPPSPRARGQSQATLSSSAGGKGDPDTAARCARRSRERSQRKGGDPANGQARSPDRPAADGRWRNLCRLR